MTGLDPYHITNKLDDEVLDVIVTRLEARAKHPFFMQMLQDYLEYMEVERFDKVLDMGCGTGVAARAIATSKGFSGSVLGIDLSSYLVNAASRIAVEAGLSDKTEFREGDTESLKIKDQTFDAVVAHTLLSHVGDPAAVLSEIRRVIKPGGLVGIFDGDYASVTFEQEDSNKAKSDEAAIISAVITQPRVMRQLPRLAKNAGLEFVKAFPYVLAEIGQADFWISAIESFRKLIPKSGAMTESEAEAWADLVLGSSEDGTFFGASNYYGYVLRRE